MSKIAGIRKLQVFCNWLNSDYVGRIKFKTLNDKRIKSCLSRFDSSEDVDEASQAPVATTSAASKSVAAATLSTGVDQQQGC